MTSGEGWIHSDQVIEVIWNRHTANVNPVSTVGAPLEGPPKIATAVGWLPFTLGHGWLGGRPTNTHDLHQVLSRVLKPQFVSLFCVPSEVGHSSLLTIVLCGGKSVFAVEVYSLLFAS